VFEFVALEHTAKNKMILAVKGGAVPSRAEVLAQVALVKGFYGITEQALEGLLPKLGEDLPCEAGKAKGKRQDPRRNC
jgi:hypothetical protein